MIGNENQLKIADFGISKIAHQYATTYCGTPYYISPEIINRLPYSVKTDVWSLGVVLYELCMRKMPFDATTMPLLSYLITKGKYKEMKGFNKVDKLVKEMLIVNPDKRSSVEELL